MMSLAQLIQTFQSGALSREAFFAEIDHVLAVDAANCARLREAVDATQTVHPLPDAVYAEVLRRIEHRQDNAEAVDDSTRIHEALAAARSATTSDDAEHVKGIGDTLNGRFVLEECLGVGGMGTVYKALDLRKLEASDRKPYIAIKVLNVQFRGQPTSLIALQREARKAQTLAHRNIVTVYDFDRDGPLVYLTMEYLSGKPLSKLLRAPGFAGMPFEKARPIIAGMGQALAYAHERGFVHCDFKPANVFLTDGGDVKVIDFGIARVFQRPEEDPDVTVFDPATLGGITPAYASPEMFEHREPDPRDDVYALACVTCELLTGKHPFNRKSATQARSDKMRAERPPDLDRGQWRTLSAALSFDRASRTASVSQFLEGMGVLTHAPAFPGARVGAIGAGAVVVAAGLWVGYRVLSGHGQTGAGPSMVAMAPASAPKAASEAPASPVLAAAPAAVVASVPAAVPASSAPVADAASVAALNATLARIPCSALAASLPGHVVQVRGFANTGENMAHVHDALAQTPGGQAAKLDVTAVENHNCEVVSAFAPYWRANHLAGGGATIHTRPLDARLTQGMPLIVDITTPHYESYVNVDYFALDGSVVHLVPSNVERDNQAPPGFSATVGGSGYWLVDKPFGTEMIVLLITPAPLFDGLRPASESRAAYLAAVEQQLKQMEAHYGTGHIAADFVQITTHARGEPQ
ncbi:serine/threonine protein kinase [Paraburkholderia silvatlantica]|nr:serine/threonine protein kinase [Paraburkholderia silvatlantica]MBB2927647.1 putative Ser/Thr protein kinase [Paraburkholderia silvatlantica]PVY36357.1 serine/threonine protein kinase [Paraburkholderia silvatlantica]PXW40226.1 serine/threonine protein kinase [Paraburkholderia silvatlantica]PYE24187.1 serine/threonine protein kinase [Paraburkholderia silvatlantica]